MKIALFTMGGTIDKDYFDALSEYQVVDSILTEECRRIGIPVEIETVPIARKDSLELDDNDRRALKDAIIAHESAHILVSHGTDTLVETAKYLEGIPGKTIVLFGAMRPLRFKDSDAIFNVGFAMGVLKASQSGVYVAMSGESFSPDSVTKNRAAGRFEVK